MSIFFLVESQLVNPTITRGKETGFTKTGLMRQLGLPWMIMVMSIPGRD